MRLVSRESSGRDRLLADAELGEDGAQHLLDIDPAGQAAEMAGSDAKLLGLELGAERGIAEALQAEKEERRVESVTTGGDCGTGGAWSGQARDRASVSQSRAYES